MFGLRQTQPFTDVLQSRCFKIFAKLWGKHLCLSLFFFLIKLKIPSLHFFIETSTQVFSSKFCEIFENTFLKNISWWLPLLRQWNFIIQGFSKLAEGMMHPCIQSYSKICLWTVPWIDPRISVCIWIYFEKLCNKEKVLLRVQYTAMRLSWTLWTCLQCNLYYILSYTVFI